MKLNEKPAPVPAGNPARAIVREAAGWPDQKPRKHRRQPSDAGAARSLYLAILLGLTLAVLLIAAANLAPDTIRHALS